MPALRLLATLLLALALGCRPATAPLTVLAASSLTEVLQAIAAAWEAGGNGDVELVFGGSSRLARQIEAGAAGDVFVSADVAWMTWAEERGLVARESRVLLAGNTLVAVVRPGGTFLPRRPADLAGADRLALPGENVPAGRYARAALRAEGAWDAVKDRVVEGDDVRTALRWVGAGEADAGVVYATDARVEPRVVVAFTFPPSSHPPIVYPAAVLARAANADAAGRFLAFCRSPEAQALLADAGFLPAS